MTTPRGKSHGALLCARRFTEHSDDTTESNRGAPTFHNFSFEIARVTLDSWKRRNFVWDSVLDECVRALGDHIVRNGYSDHDHLLYGPNYRPHDGLFEEIELNGWTNPTDHALAEFRTYFGDNMVAGDEPDYELMDIGRHAGIWILHAYPIIARKDYRGSWHGLMHGQRLANSEYVTVYPPHDVDKMNLEPLTDLINDVWRWKR